MGAEQKVLLMRKPDKAQEIAQQEMAFYLSLSNYRNIWKRLGFTGGSNRFLDAMARLPPRTKRFLCAPIATQTRKPATRRQSRLRRRPLPLSKTGAYGRALN